MKRRLTTTVFAMLIAVLALTISCNSTAQSETDKQDSTTANTATATTTTTTAATPGKPQQMTKADFLAKVMNYEKNTKEWVFEGDRPCIIDFYADWCGPCRRAAPILEELAKEYEGRINVYKVDTQQEQELAGIFGIQSIPAFLFCPKDGKPQMSQGIGSTDAETKEMFVKYIESYLLKTQ